MTVPSSPQEPIPAPTAPGRTAGARLWLELAALAGLVVGLVAVARAWPHLPETVPMHFDAAGRPDGWGGRSSILLLPGASVFLYVLLSLVERLPARWYNYPVAVTEENLARQHRLARDLVLWLKAALSWMFADITVRIVGTASGAVEGLGAWTVYLWLALVFGLLGVYLAKSRRAR